MSGMIVINTYMLKSTVSNEFLETVGFNIYRVD